MGTEGARGEKGEAVGTEGTEEMEETGETGETEEKRKREAKGERGGIVSYFRIPPKWSSRPPVPMSINQSRPSRPTRGGAGPGVLPALRGP